MLTRQIFEAQEVPEEIWSLACDWRAANPSYRSPFFSTQFTKLISQLRSDVRIAVAADEKGPVLIWPLHLSGSGWAYGIGGPYSDRNGPLLRPGADYALTDLLDALNISGFVTNGLSELRGLIPDTERAEATYITDLSSGWDAFFQAQRALYPKHFKRLGRLERKLEREHPGVEFTFNDQDDGLIDQLFALKSKQFSETGRHNVLASQWARQMFDRLRASDDPDCQTIFSTLKQNDRLIAAELNLRSGDAVNGWIVGYDPEFASYSPGNLVTLKLLQAMPEHGMVWYDAGPGNHYFKKYVSNAEQPIQAGVFKASRRSAHPGSLFRSSWDYLERHTPTSLSEHLMRIRRRADVICAAETEFDRRVAGFVRAALPSKPRSSEQ